MRFPLSILLSVAAFAGDSGRICLYQVVSGIVAGVRCDHC